MAFQRAVRGEGPPFNTVFDTIPQYEVMEETYNDDFEPGEEDVLEQCYAMGIDPIKEKDLVYIAIEALKAPLPEAWKPVADGQGGIFFHNFTTGESTWEHPCDQFYLQQLEQEREKKKHLTTPTTTNNNNKINRPLHGQSKGMGGVGGVASSLRNVPPLAPLKAPELTNPFLSDGSPLKKPVLDPIGGATGAARQLNFPGPLNSLPPLRPPQGGGHIPPLNSLAPSTNGPSLNQVDHQMTPPLSHPPLSSTSLNQTTPTTNNMGGASITSSSLGKAIAMETESAKQEHQRQQKILLEELKISTEYKAEESEEESEEDSSKSLSFGAKFNVKGIEDELGPLSTTGDSQREGDGESNGDGNKSNEESSEDGHPGALFGLSHDQPIISINQPLPLPTDLSVFTSAPSLETSTQITGISPLITGNLSQQGILGSSPQKIATSTQIFGNSSQGLLNTAPQIIGTSPQIISGTSSQGILSNSPLNSPRRTPITSNNTIGGNDVIKPSLSVGLNELVDNERVEMERQHYSTLERLRQEHSDELQKLKRRYAKEIEEEMTSLAKDKEKRLAMEREQQLLELSKRETLLKEEHQMAIDQMKGEFKEREEEEEARLEENKQTVLRNMKRKIDSEQKEQEVQLKEKRDALLQQYETSLQEEREKEEREMRETHTKEMETIKLQLEEERERKKKEIEDQFNNELEKIKNEMKTNFDKVKLELTQEHSQSLDSMRHTLTKEHEANLITLRQSIEEEFKVKQIQLEEQRTLHQAMEEEVDNQWENKRNVLQEQHNKTEASLIASFNDELSQLKERHCSELEQERSRHSTLLQQERVSHLETLENLRETHRQELATERETHERELVKMREEFEGKMASLGEERETKLKGLQTQLERDIATEREKQRETLERLQREQSSILHPLPPSLPPPLPPPLPPSLPHTHVNRTITGITTTQTLPLAPPTTDIAINNKEQKREEGERGADDIRHRLQEQDVELQKLKTIHHDLARQVQSLQDVRRHSLLIETQNEQHNNTCGNNMNSSSDSSEKEEEKKRDEKEERVKFGPPKSDSTQTESDDDNLELYKREKQQHRHSTTLWQPNYVSPPSPLSPPKVIVSRERRKEGEKKRGGKNKRKNNNKLEKNKKEEEKGMEEERDFLLERIQSKLEKEATAIRMMENRLSHGNQKLKEFSQQLLDEFEKFNSDDDNTSITTDTNSRVLVQDIEERDSNTSDTSLLPKDHSPLTTTSRINKLRHQLIKQGLLEPHPPRHHKTKTHSHTSNRTHSHTTNGTHSHRTKAHSHTTSSSMSLRIEDLQDSSGVSSSIELSSSSTDDQSNYSNKRSPRPPAHYDYLKLKSRGRKSNKRPHSPINNTATDPIVTSALDQISSQLGEVLECLNEDRSLSPNVTPTATPSISTNSTRWADPLSHTCTHTPSCIRTPYNANTVPVHTHTGELNTGTIPSRLDVSLQEKWRQYIDASAVAKQQPNSSTLVIPPPLPKSQVDQDGRALIRKHRDWLNEFRQSLPRPSYHPHPTTSSLN